MTDWLFKTTLDISFLIALISLIRPVVRSLLGAQVAYWLWSLPLVQVLSLALPHRPVQLDAIASLPDAPVLSELTSNVAAMPVHSLIAVESIWITGVGMVAVWQFLRHHRFLKMVSDQSQTMRQTQGLAKSVRALCDAHAVEIWSTQLVGAPFVAHLMYKRIYLPDDFQERHSANAQIWIVKHEIAHIQRRDLWVQLTAEILRTIFWFNPLIHFAIRAMRKDQEYACDHAILQSADLAERHEYGSALLKSVGPTGPSPAMSFNSYPKERFSMLRKHRKSNLNSVIGLCLCLTISAFTLTKAPNAIADQSLFSPEPIMLNFQQIELNKVMELIFEFSKITEVVGRDKLEGIVVTSVKAKNVTSARVTRKILACYGLSYVEHSTWLELVDVDSPTPASQCDEFFLQGEIQTH